MNWQVHTKEKQTMVMNLGSVDELGAKDHKLVRVERVAGGLWDVGKRLKFASRDMLRARIVSSWRKGDCLAVADTMEKLDAACVRLGARIVSRA